MTSSQANIMKIKENESGVKNETSTDNGVPKIFRKKHLQSQQYFVTAQSLALTWSREAWGGLEAAQSSPLPKWTDVFLTMAIGFCLGCSGAS